MAAPLTWHARDAKAASKRNDTGWLRLSLKAGGAIALDLPDGRAIAVHFGGREGNYVRLAIDLPADVDVTRIEKAA